MEKSVKMVLALLIIILLTLVVAYATLPYINYIFGAFILFVIFRSLYQFLINKLKIQKQFAAVFVIVISIFVVLIPFYFLLSIIIGEIQQLLLDRAAIVTSIQAGGQFFSYFLTRLYIPTETIQTQIEARVMDVASEAVNYTSLLILGSIQSLSRQSIGLLIMYFLLYYLFTEEDSTFAHRIYCAIPFNDQNTKALVDEFRVIVRTTLIASGAISIFQGAVLTLVFLFFDIQGAFLWGAIAAILSFLPVVGAPLVWIPAAIFQIFQRDYTAGIVILAAGGLISVIDYFLRPIIQKKVGEIHPFLSLLGIVIGVSLFGLIGIVIGPLLLSYFVLTIEMFSKEYVSKTE
jgi:predicted PurR-regulated permease PerM